MVGSRRRDRRHWPDYLLARKTTKGDYYYWRDPRTGKEYGLGYDFPEAAAQAREANAKLAMAKQPRMALLDRVEGRDVKRLREWLDLFGERLELRKGKKGRERSVNTKKADKFRLNTLRGLLPLDKLMIDVSVEDCAKVIQHFERQDKATMANTLRAVMVDCFTEAEAAGWLPKGTNPAAYTKAVAVQIKRARMDLDTYLAVLAWAEKNNTPLRIAMLLALLSGQRESDVVSIAFAQPYKDLLAIEQEKEKHRIRIPMALGLPEVGLTIADVFKLSRKLGVVGAKTVVHRLVAYKHCVPGDAYTAQAISDAFRRAMRSVFSEKEAAKRWPNNTPPTFHEIRSLAKELYDGHGVDTQKLLGHADEKTAKLYTERRKEWIDVELPKLTA